MKIALLIVVGILFWTSDDARNFTADQLNTQVKLRVLMLRRKFLLLSDHENLSTALVIIIGANLGLSLLMPNMAQMMKERNETIQRQLQQ